MTLGECCQPSELLAHLEPPQKVAGSVQQSSGAVPGMWVGRQICSHHLLDLGAASLQIHTDARGSLQNNSWGSMTPGSSSNSSTLGDRPCPWEREAGGVSRSEGWVPDWGTARETGPPAAES